MYFLRIHIKKSWKASRRNKRKNARRSSWKNLQISFFKNCWMIFFLKRTPVGNFEISHIVTTRNIQIKINSVVMLMDTSSIHPLKHLRNIFRRLGVGFNREIYERDLQKYTWRDLCRNYKKKILKFSLEESDKKFVKNLQKNSLRRSLWNFLRQDSFASRIKKKINSHK